jgi:predicted nucleic acid-binding protein
VTRFVVDASVAVKWFVAEVHAPAAQRLLDPAHTLIAPDWIWPEVANVLWRKGRMGEITLDIGRRILSDFARYPLATSAARPLVPAALEIAAEVDCTVYDGLYLALAVRESCALVTADRRLWRAARASGLSSRAQWIEDAP